MTNLRQKSDSKFLNTINKTIIYPIDTINQKQTQNSKS